MEHRPVYDWHRAKAGDQSSPVTREVRRDDVLRYQQLLGDRHPALQDGVLADRMLVPPVLIRIYAPLRRREMIAELGADYVDHSTPAVRWHAEWLGKVRVGDVITSVTRVNDKYERHGRRYLVWEVAGRNQDAQPVVRFDYVNLWDRGRPEDRVR